MSKRIEKTDSDNKEPVIVLEFPLSEPIMAYGEEVRILRMRQPMGVDLLQVGNPVKFYPHTEPPTIEHDYPKVIAMAARLANVPSSSLSKMSAGEMTSLAWEISRFFIPAM